MCISFNLINDFANIACQSYDFYYGHGLIIVNLRGIIKVGLSEELNKENIHDDNFSAIRWKSKFGSVTFNQFGRELPTCGINENGLVITSMWHDRKNKGTSIQSENGISELQWIQYQLDCYASTEEVIQNINKIQVNSQIYPLHYMVTDKQKNAAIIEMDFDNSVKVYRTEFCACSNAGYFDSIEYVKKKDSSLKATEIIIKEGSLDRFWIAYLAVKEFRAFLEKNRKIDYAFNILDNVSQNVGTTSIFNWIAKGVPPSQTFWQIAFDIVDMQIFFRTKQSSTIKIINVLDFNYSSNSPCKVLDVNTTLSGSVNNVFSTYRREDNRRIVRKSFRPVKHLFNTSEQEKLIVYPEILTKSMHSNKNLQIEKMAQKHQNAFGIPNRCKAIALAALLIGIVSIFLFKKDK